MTSRHPVPFYGETHITSVLDLSDPYQYSPASLEFALQFRISPSIESTIPTSINSSRIMAPSATEVEAQTPIAIHPGKLEAASSTAKFSPVKSNGSLDKYEHFESTPIIGREYPKLNLVELLQAPNSEELLKELALTSMFTDHSGSRSQIRSMADMLLTSLPTRRRLLPRPG